MMSIINTEVIEALSRECGNKILEIVSKVPSCVSFHWVVDLGYQGSQLGASSLTHQFATLWLCVAEPINTLELASISYQTYKLILSHTKWFLSYTYWFH